ncbi:molecular chaperone Skp [Moellerella wisconsensis]|uniref:Chaperone protein Skp n=1 Tax=Moellerella wisconsensis ATCC 35017 TaxID=1354267 RepID=A0A0N1KJ43_9GAMM|nr:molecular chaperone Skp [Moellerella wisconsensis]KPD04354.1 OmpH family outer membrane chaperone [Moellerella wisconsensis ATCC 35017]VFS52776.1 Outer membrane protein ompH [Moellerella wisconsensis]
MKKLLCAAGMSLALAMSAGAYADKVAVVNVGEIFQNMPASDAVAKQLESEFKSRGTELQNMEKDLQSRVEKLRRDGATMKQSDREKQEKDLIAKRDQFAEKAQKFEEDNRRRHMEERNKILARIQASIKTIAAKEGYDVVIDANAVAYAKDSVDITKQVQKQVK